MEERRVCQAKIVEALEEEKKKLSRELEDMQKKRAQREIHTPRTGENHPIRFPLQRSQDFTWTEEYVIVTVDNEQNLLSI